MDVNYIILLLLMIIMLSLSIYNAYKIYNMKLNNEETIDDINEENVNIMTDTLDDFEKKTNRVQINTTTTSEKLGKLEKKIDDIYTKQDDDIKKMNDNETDINTLSNIVNDNKIYIDSVKNFDMSKLSNQLSVNTEYIDSLSGFEFNNIAKNSFDMSKLSNQLSVNTSTIDNLLVDEESEKYDMSTLSNQLSVNTEYIDSLSGFEFNNIAKNSFDVSKLSNQLSANTEYIDSLSGFEFNNIAKNSFDIIDNRRDIDKLLVEEENDQKKTIAVTLTSNDENVEYDETMYYDIRYEFKNFSVMIKPKSHIPDNLFVKVIFNSIDYYNTFTYTSLIDITTFQIAILEGNNLTNRYNIKGFEFIDYRKDYKLFIIDRIFSKNNLNTILFDPIRISYEKRHLARFYSRFFEHLTLITQNTYKILIKGTTSTKDISVSDYEHSIYILNKNTKLPKIIYDKIMKLASNNNYSYIGLEVIDSYKFNVIKNDVLMIEDIRLIQNT